MSLKSFRASSFQNFLEGMPPEPPSKILPRLLQRSGYGPEECYFVAALVDERLLMAYFENKDLNILSLSFVNQLNVPLLKLPPLLFHLSLQVAITTVRQ